MKLFSTSFSRIMISTLVPTFFAALSGATGTIARAANDPVLINGAGATFPYPLYTKWFSTYEQINPATRINYQSIGSGGGITQFSNGIVHFGATDAPMKDEQIAKAKGGPLLHIPTVLGAVVLTYNLPGVAKGLKLSSDVVADIFLGKLTQWTDPRIAKENPGVQLPANTPILVARRSDGSGTSAIFTDYLSKISPEWKEKVGQGTAVNWPVGLGGKGNEGVTGVIKNTPGAIGYVELIYAENNHLPFASLKNKSGQYVMPSTKSVTAAAAAFTKAIPDDFRVSIVDGAGKDAYPIAGFTYLLIYQKMPKDIGEKLVGFLKWAMKDGQKAAEALYYAPLPADLVKRVEAKIATISVQ